MGVGKVYHERGTVKVPTAFSENPGDIIVFHGALETRANEAAANERRAVIGSAEQHVTIDIRRLALMPGLPEKLRFFGDLFDEHVHILANARLQSFVRDALLQSHQLVAP